LYHAAPIAPAVGVKVALLGVATIYIVQIGLRSAGVPGLVASALGDVAVIAFLILATRGRGDLADIVGWRRAPTRLVIASALIGAAAWYLNLWLVELSHVPENEHARREVERLIAQTPLVPTVLAIGVMPAIAEELVFRGVLARSLAGRLPALAAIAISSAVFAVYHLQLAQMVTTFMLGLALGYLTLRARSIVPAMICHFLNNTIAVVVARDEVPAANAWIADHPVAMLAGSAVLVGGGLVLAARGDA
jgi:membrane protease YdiL (CAAX protease family)